MKYYKNLLFFKPSFPCIGCFPSISIKNDDILWDYVFFLILFRRKAQKVDLDPVPAEPNHRTFRNKILIWK